ncbi:MAG: phosphatase PAP2 family protein, partial [Terriglobales bacterium]
QYAARSLRDDLWSIACSPLEIGKAAALLGDRDFYLTLAKVLAILGVAYLLDTTIKEAITESIAPILAPLQTVGKVLLYSSLTLWYVSGLYLRSSRPRQFALTSLEAAGAAGLLADLFKFTFGRRRPRQSDLHSLWFAGGRSFPSGEVTPSAAIAAGLSAYWGDRRYVSVVCYSFALMVGLGRMGRNAHWFSDVVGAMMLGYLTLRLFLWMHGLRDGRDSGVASD